MTADEFNALYEVGVPVFAYPGVRPEDIPSARRLVTRTRTQAQAVGLDRDGVVWVDGHGAYISLSHVDVIDEDEYDAAKLAEAVAAVPVPVSDKPQTLGHATPAETIPALLATIKELRDLRAPLIDALTTVYRSMTSCVGDEWAMEWLGEVWTQIPLAVRAAAGDEDAAAELVAEDGDLR